MPTPENISDFERLQTAVDAAGVGTWEFDPLTGELLWSKRCKELFGASPEALINYQRFLEGLHPDDRAATDAVVQQALDPAGNGEYDIEYRTIGLEDKKLRWVHATGRAFFDQGRTRAVRFIGTVTDVTETRRRDLHLGRLLESDLIGIVFWNLDTQRITEANNAFLSIVGYSREDLQAGHISWKQMTPPELEALEASVIKELEQTGVQRPYEKMYIRKDGTRVPVLLGGALAEPGGRDGVSFCLDLTAQKEVEAQLATREAEFRFVIEFLPQMIWLTDPQGYHTFFNQRWIDYTGYDVAQSRGTQMWNDLLHPDDQQRSRDRWNHSLTTGEFYEIEYRFKAKDGTYHWFLGQAMPVKDEAGNITQWFGSCTDIDEQKRTEATLRWSQERYELASLATNDAIWDWDLNTQAVSWNAAITRIFGYAPEAVEQTAQWWYNHIHPDDAERIVHGIHEIIDGGGKSWHDEYRYQRADGSYAQVLDRGYIAHDAKGNATRMIGAMQDITEYRKAETALRQREEEFTTLADNMAQLAWMSQPDGHIYWYNQRWYDFTGTTLEEMQGWGWEKVHHPAHVEQVVAFVQAAWSAGEPWELTFPLRGKDGNYRWFLTRAVPMRNAQGQLVRWLGTNTDITEQKQLQEQLERSYADLEAKIMFRTLDLEHQVQELQRRLAEATK
ncbi:PAS domain-containing protein [Hymenobacter crusticola]|uniref:histidine kinase n=1 Tax=Hymenobacter crusticola TaxID=1770526 RepID=A0A243WAK5_9BACT|nr:PAS domain-containing protein [Hymenobacter crusticola]OUJ71379.1 hypothetical protein BXP70_21720 [Hymenobacter crusticola]